MAKLQELVLEELYYESLTASLDLENLLSFQLDLRVSIDRQLRSLSRSQEEREGLAMEYLLRAWDRIGDESTADVPDYIDVEPVEALQ